MDLETWHRDRLNVRQATRWLELLLRADPERLAGWCFGEKLDYVEFYLFRNLEVRVREQDHTPSDFGEGFVSDDETFYVRPVGYPVATEEEKAFKDRRDKLLERLLRRLSRFDHRRYQGLLMEAAAVIPAEMEEELFRWRNVRLAEKGFLPFNEAIGVYQPMHPDDLARRGRKVVPPPVPGVEGHLVPRIAGTFLEGDNLFVRALKSIGDPLVVQLLQTEFAGLCNQLISADQAVIKGRGQLLEAVDRASGYLSIGLERLTRQSPRPSQAACAGLLQRHLLVDLFRIGFSQPLTLKWKMSRWQKGGWAHTKQLGLAFWDETWFGLLGGLLIHPPKHYDPDGKPSKYRDFRTLAEVEAADRQLASILMMDRLLGAIDPLIAPDPGPRLVTYKNLLLTLWARSALGFPERQDGQLSIEIPLSDFTSFFEALWSGDQREKQIGDEKKGEFLNWLATSSGMPAEVLSDRLGEVFEALFDELQHELAPVKTGDLDPRFVTLFLLKR